MIIPRRIIFPSQALPGGGALSNPTVFDMPAGTTDISLDCTYTRGAAGGFPIFQILWGNSVEELRAIVIDKDSLAVAGADGEFNVYLEEPKAPAPVDGNPLSWTFEYTVPGGKRAMRLLAAERGATANPGTLQIALTGYGP